MGEVNTFKYDNPIVLSLVNLQEMWEEHKENATVVNDVQINTDKRRDELLSLLTKTYDSESFSEPTDGENPLFEKIEPSVWLKPITPGAKFINPAYLTMLESGLKRDKFSIIQHLLDPTYPDPVKYSNALIKAYFKAGFKRGFVEFYQQFDDIVNLLLIEPFNKRLLRADMQGKPLAKTPADCLAEITIKYRDAIFTDALPLPSAHLFVVEQKGKTTKSELSLMEHVFDAVSTITSLGDRIKPVSTKECGRLDFKINAKHMGGFYQVYNTNYLKAKKGIFRKNNYGTSTSFNSRCVIVSRQGINAYDSLKISYPIAFKLFELHIAKVFIDKYDYTPIDIFELRSNYSRQFNPLVHKTMMELIENYWGGCGWSVNFLRHPYLSRLSSQNLFIDGIGTDPSEFVMAVHPLALKGFNADFDGDEMITNLHLDLYTKMLMSPTQPHHSAIDTNEPFAYNNELDFPKPPITQFYRWLGYDKL